MLKRYSREVVSVLHEFFGSKNSGLMFELRVLVGLGRSGRLLAFIMLQYHLSTPWWRRVVTKNLKNFTSIKFTTIQVWAYSILKKGLSRLFCRIFWKSFYRHFQRSLCIVWKNTNPYFGPDSKDFWFVGWDFRICWEILGAIFGE